MKKNSILKNNEIIITPSNVYPPLDEQTQKELTEQLRREAESGNHDPKLSKRVLDALEK